MPTNTTSPSRSSRAAATTIISLGEYSVAIRDFAAHGRLRREASGQRRLPSQVFGAIGDAVHPLVEIRLQPRRVSRDVVPRHVKLVVAIVVSLRIGRMRAPRLH